MAVVESTPLAGPEASENGRDPVLVGLLVAALVLVLAHAFGVLPAWLHRIPEALIPPTAEVLDVVFAFVQNDLGLIHLTRFIAEGPLEFMLDTTANLLYGKRRWPFLGPIPWAAIAFSAAVLGYYLGGWKMAALAGGSFAWIGKNRYGLAIG